MASNRLTKSELVDSIAAETGLSKVDVRRVVASLQETIVDAVVDGKSVTLTHFASFAPQTRDGQTWTNPGTGEVMELPSKKIVRISALSEFKSRVSDNS